jgi:hypothetical protein
MARAKGWALAALGVLGVVASSSSTASAPRDAVPAGARLRAALLTRATEDTGGRVVEAGGANRGPIVDRYLANVGLGPGQNWCAATAWTWLRDAAHRVGADLVLEVIPATGMAKAFRDAVLHARPAWWHSAEEVRSSSWRPPSGSFAIWDRSNPPGSSWQGHIGVVRDWRDDGSWFGSIEGNSGVAGDRVAAMDRPLADSRLLGFVVFPDDLEATGPAALPTSPLPAAPSNPPAPGVALQQSEVTPAMTAWAVSLVHSALPMHSVSHKDFDGRAVLGRIEWHTHQAATGKDFPQGIRAASLYWPRGVA